MSTLEQNTQQQQTQHQKAQSWLSKEKEISMLILSRHIAASICSAPITIEKIMEAKHDIERMEALYNSIVDECKSRDWAVLGSDGT